MVKVEVEMVAMICGECGIAFEMPKQVYDERYNVGGRWFCPNGHSRVFKEPEVVRLSRLLDSERASHAETQRKLDRESKAHRKLERRIAAGVCPCCHRTFSQLSRHIKTKHPDFIAVIQ